MGKKETAAKNAWMLANKDRMSFLVPKEAGKGSPTRAEIKDHAALYDSSTNAFLTRAVMETMARDRLHQPGDSPADQANINACPWFGNVFCICPQGDKANKENQVVRG